MFGLGSAPQLDREGLPAPRPNAVAMAQAEPDWPEAYPEPRSRFSSSVREPEYIEVRANHILLYPGEKVVAAEQIEVPGGLFLTLLDKVESKKTKPYIVLIVRPGGVALYRRLKTLIQERGIDVGTELMEEVTPRQIENLNRE